MINHKYFCVYPFLLIFSERGLFPSAPRTFRGALSHSAESVGMCHDMINIPWDFWILNISTKQKLNRKMFRLFLDDQLGPIYGKNS